MLRRPLKELFQHCRIPCSIQAAGGGLNSAMISHASTVGCIKTERQLFLIHTYWVFYLLIDLTCALAVRSHPEDPPRPFNWSAINLFHATLRLSLNTTVSPPSCLASDWCVCRPCSSDELPDSQLFAANTFLAKSRRSGTHFIPSFRLPWSPYILPSK